MPTRPYQSTFPKSIFLACVLSYFPYVVGLALSCRTLGSVFVQKTRLRCNCVLCEEWQHFTSVFFFWFLFEISNFKPNLKICKGHKMLHGMEYNMALLTPFSQKSTCGKRAQSLVDFLQKTPSRAVSKRVRVWLAVYYRIGGA